MKQKSLSEKDWLVETFVEEGVSIGANATILPGIRLGRYCMIGAGSVVTKDVAPFALVAGNPARVIGKVDEAGDKVA
jgi:UDP-2-acetamido-3-amino-2,3-dideoxy-glucuronate N-acetyltransferase